MVSIVIPAHNEAAVIGANLRRLLAGTEPGEFDVIVVPNACRDRTAEAAAEVPGVRVIETSVPGKVPALRLGDEACKTFPRVYLDADVELTAGSVRALVAACARPGVLAAAPVPELDLAGVGRLVRRVHRVHDRMIAPSRALAGVGVYVLTEAGHARVFPMPDVIADDGWVHTTFAPDERAVVAEARSVVRPARTVQAHLNRRVRVRRGNRELAALDRAHAGGPGLGSLAGLVRRREVSPIDAAAYLSVLVLDRAVSRVRRDKAGWGSDLSTRAATAPAE
ncbi:glycosyltransferase [Dactylosporangium sp. CS-047395]|uniref:glycosyltransferase n=1 Tax=Dactylosporangium sp. CS-047395 TaxID=3239936 RepID=UPI003D8AD5AB